MLELADLRIGSDVCTEGNILRDKYNSKHGLMEAADKKNLQQREYKMADSDVEHSTRFWYNS